MDVEIWSDVVCPWCYLGKKHFEHALESFDHRAAVDLVYRSFELDAAAQRGVTLPTVELLASKYGMSTDDAVAAQRQMEQRAAEVGLEFHLEGLRSGNTRDSHRLLHLAKTHRLQPALMERLHRAYFTEQQSIFEAAPLTELAVEVGLDRAEVTNLLDSDEYGADVDADEDMARAIGVTGVPFFVIDRRFAVSGAQPADVIVASLEHAWTEAARSEA
jgi:predicted DsbA family dithiol-disulfide isomerase